MYILDIDLLQPGDIVLSAQDAKTSKAVRRLTGSIFSHAILCVARGSYIHSDIDGVHSNNIQRLLLEDESHALGLRLVKAEDRKKIPRICEFARSKIGVAYSIPQAVASFRKRVGGVDLHSNRQFCSRLVAQAYAYGGVALVRNPDYCYPTELYNLDLVAHVPGAVRLATEPEIAFANSPSPLETQKSAINVILAAVRRASGDDIQNEEQLVALLLRKPELDEAASAALAESGHLDLWRLDVQANSWRWKEDVFAAARPPADIRAAEVSMASEDLTRFNMTRSFYLALERKKPLRYFALQRDLYERLVAMNLRRRNMMLPSTNA